MDALKPKKRFMEGEVLVRWSDRKDLCAEGDRVEKIRLLKVPGGLCAEEVEITIRSPGGAVATMKNFDHEKDFIHIMMDEPYLVYGFFGRVKQVRTEVEADEDYPYKKIITWEVLAEE